MIDWLRGLIMHLIWKQPEPNSFLIREFGAVFHKRTYGDVRFCCDQGRAMADFGAQAAASDDGIELPVRVVATTPDQGNGPVATFGLTLLLKRER